MGAVRRILLFLSAAAMALAFAPVAHADTYCVNTAGCIDPVHDKGSDLQAALDAAQAGPGPDTIQVGAGTIDHAGGFSYPGPEPVHIEGSGGRLYGITGPRLVDTAGATSKKMLKVLGPGSTISGLTVVIPSGADNVGIETDGTISNVLVHGNESSTPATGVLLDAGGVLADSDVLLSISAIGRAVEVAGAGTTVTDSRLQSVTGYRIRPGAGAGASGLLRRARVEVGGTGIFMREGTITVEDSLIVARLDSAFPAHTGLSVNSFAPGTSLSASHVTLVGDLGPNSRALEILNAGSANSATAVFRNGIITGYPIVFSRVASTGTSNIATDYSNYGGTTFASVGTGSITETNHLTGDPGFLSPTVYHLAAGSSLIDAGDPAGLASGESATDLAGQPRIADGDGNCAARRDLGAFEFTPGPRAPRAAAVASPPQALTGQSIGFDAAASCDADGGALTYAWSFDDGTTTAGATVQHAFSSPGAHFGAVTVTDPTGRADTATAGVFVTVPVTTPPPIFAGVTIAKQTVRVSKKGVAKVQVGCPAATVGACAGTLALAGGRAAFSIAPRLIRNVTVRLSKGKLGALRKKKRLKVSATALAHDVNGSSKTSTGKITLLAPR